LLQAEQELPFKKNPPTVLQVRAVLAEEHVTHPVATEEQLTQSVVL